MCARRVNLSQGWQRVLGELALIVGGVLIALTLDAWWAGHQERQQEIAYLEQLLADLEETQRRLHASIAGDSATSDVVSRVLERAFEGPLPPRDSLSLQTGYSQFRPLTGTQTALLQGGGLQLLRSDSLRFALIAYSALTQATETILRHAEGLIWNSAQRVIHARARHSQQPQGARPGQAPRWTQIDVAGVLSDPDLVSALQVQVVASENRIRNLRRLEEPVADLIRLLQAELEGR